MTTHDTAPHHRQARARPRHRHEGALAGRQGRPPDRPAREAAHHRLGRAGHAAARRPGRRRPRRHPVGQPPRRRRSAPTSASSTASPCRSGTRCSAARPTTWPRWPRRPSAGSVTFRLPEGRDATRARTASRKAVGAGVRRIDAAPPRARALIKKVGDAPRKPWIYLIVATGDIYEDIPQAQAAAREGADVIAVIRSTGQSLLDYVPEGADPRGLRRHLRHPGELPADAGGARRDQHASSAATSG